MTRVSDVHVITNTALPSPREMLAEIPRGDAHAAFVSAARAAIARIISGSDPRFLLIAGPCSIHDLEGGREYAERLANLAAEVRDRILVVMRVYFEKPRTTLGWKGLIMDPHLDGTNDIPAGMRLARTFLRDVLDLGVPTATEMLDPITPQYIADLTCWTAIGARTTESQTHRQMASGLSMPVGFKNTTSGAVTPAINAIKAAVQRQTFLGPNHTAASVGIALGALEKAGLPPNLMVDASHANCAKDCERMPAAFREIVAQRAAGARGIIGAMLESNLVAGAQSLGNDRGALVYGQSITDQCIDWATTETLVREAAMMV